MPIIDVHYHFFSRFTLQAITKIFGNEFAERLSQQNPERFQRFINLLPPLEQAKLIINDMKDKKIDQIILMSFSYDHVGAFQVHQAHPKFFPGVIPFLNPEIDDDPDIVAEWKKQGAVAVKLYPGMWEEFTFSDERLLPYLKALREHDLVPMIHFGVMKGGLQVGWPANPMELKPWLKHPSLEDLKFVIAHFGAGFLREVLLIAYGHGKRIYVDSSGSNDWIFYSPWQDLTHVFKKTINALGSDHVLFGTDSGLELLREDVISRQVGILTDLVTKKIITNEDVNRILHENARELFKLK